MPALSPSIVVLGGPNGAGKSTSAPRLLGGLLKVGHFVNTDTIAQGLSAFRPEDVALDAGRITLRRLDELDGQRESFAFEATLAKRSPDGLLGSRPVVTQFISFFSGCRPPTSPSPESLNVFGGGHGVPSDAVRRRFARGLRSFFTVYRPAADTWRLYDSSSIRGPHLVASGGIMTETRVRDRETWRVASGKQLDE